MNKVAIIEHTGLISIKLQKLILTLGVDEAEIINVRYLKMKALDHALEGVKVLFLDLEYPDLDVHGLINEIRSSSSLCNLPIIVLSAKMDAGILKQAISEGANDFILLPYQKNTVVSKLVHWLNIEQDIINDSDDEKIEKRFVEMKWNQAFEIGVESVDNEHKTIVENFEKLYQLMRQGTGHAYYKELIDFLEDYVNTHFSNEEAFQKSIKYPGFNEHVRAHSWFKNQVKLIAESVKDRSVENRDLIQINLFIRDWLTNHILIEDTKIGEYYKKSSSN